MTHYETLGVAPRATKDEIRAAYLREAKNWHPDKGGDPDRFQVISEAYGVLKDDRLREGYDLKLALTRSRKQCVTCGGTGKLYRQITFTRRDERECSACYGTGYE